MKVTDIERLDPSCNRGANLQRLSDSGEAKNAPEKMTILAVGSSLVKMISTLRDPRPKRNAPANRLDVLDDEVALRAQWRDGLNLVDFVQLVRRYRPELDRDFKHDLVDVFVRVPLRPVALVVRLGSAAAQSYVLIIAGSEVSFAYGAGA